MGGAHQFVVEGSTHLQSLISSLKSFADHDLPSELDSESRTCLHAAACGGYVNRHVTLMKTLHTFPAT